METPTKQFDELFAPAAISVTPNYIQVGEKFARTIFLSTYPRYLQTSWFSPVINLDRVLDISIYVNAKSTATTLKQLRDNLAKIESQAMEEAAAGKVRDPLMETAIGDIESLRDRLQQGTDKLFDVGVYITIYENSLKDLDETESKIKGLFEYQLVYPKPTVFRMSEGFMSTLPLGKDRLNVYTPLNTEPLSSIFPFVSFDLTSNSGILYGINTHNNSLVLFDRFNLENANAVVFGKSGGGKSIGFSEPVLIKRDGEIKMAKIGPLVDDLINKEYGATRIDNELEGVTFPNIKVWSFDKNLKGSWSNVTVAARKKAPKNLYRFETQSGRVINTTGDHSMVVMNNGAVRATRGSDIKIGQYVPLPRHIDLTDNESRSLNLLKILKKSRKIYISGAEKIIQENYEFLKKALIDKKLDRYLYKYRQTRVIPIHYFLKICQHLELMPEDSKFSNLQIVSKNGKSCLPASFPLKNEFLKLLGYIVSEGTITKKQVIISNIDSEVIRDVSQALISVGGLFFTTDRSIVISDRSFVEIVEALGGKQKSAFKRVLPFIFNSSRQNMASYLQAYFEGDGGVEHASVSAVSKSKQLISDLCYLLYYFGIVARIRKTEKRAPNWKNKKIYWKLTISGQDNLRKFADNINFISKRKKNLLSKLIGLNGNTNVDIIPELNSIFKEIYELLPSQFYDLQIISPLKRGIFNPSPENLKVIINKIGEKIERFKTLDPILKPLSLPDIQSVIKAGASSQVLNQKLWVNLGHSWQLMKRGKISPKSQNVLRALKVTNPEYTYSLTDIKNAIRSGIGEIGINIKQYNSSLQSALMTRPNSNTSYQMIWNSSQYILEQYYQKLKNIEKIEQLLNKLNIFANSDLFWDPIVKIEKTKNTKNKYVYDLTVDNEVFLAGYGGMIVHNSYTIKLEILRTLVFGAQAIIIDPEDEYKYLSETVGGSNIKISINSDQHINPFDLPIPHEDESPGDVFKSHILNLIGLLRLMLGEMTPEENSILDEGIRQTYAIKDITPDSDFTKISPPLLSDFQNILEGMTGGESLVLRLKRYTEGTFAGFLNQPTNVSLANQMIVFSIRDMEEELRPIAMYLVLNYIWIAIRRNLAKRILIVDEAWLLMRYEIGANFLSNIAKRARKYYTGLTTISQDIPEFLATDYGKSILNNSSIQMLMKQSPATVDLIQKTFNLTDTEKLYLLEARVGFGLFFLGQAHIGIRVVSSFAEDQIITSDPKQILEIEKAKEEWAKSQS